MDSTNKFLKKNLSQEHHGPRRFSWQTCFPYNVGWWIEHQRMTETKLTKCFCSPVLASMVVCVMITIPKQYMLHRCVDGTVRMLLYRSTVIYEELSSRVWSSRNYALYAGPVTLYYDTHGAGVNTRYMILSFSFRWASEETQMSHTEWFCDGNTFSEGGHAFATFSGVLVALQYTYGKQHASSMIPKTF